MSYILDALNKAEKERQLGNVPTLDSQHELQGPTKKNIWLILAMVAIVINLVLLFIVFKSVNNQSEAGYAIQKKDNVDSVSAVKHPSVPTAPAPEQKIAESDPIAIVIPERTIADTEPVQSTTAIQSSNNPMMEAETITTPKRLVDQLNPEARSKQIAQTMLHSDQAAQGTVETQTSVAPVVKPETDAKAKDPNSDDIPLLAMKPPEFQQLIPHLNVDVHVYSEDPAKRFVLLNLEKYRSGDEISTGLVLEEITNGGLVLNYNGERFRILRP